MLTTKFVSLAKSLRMPVPKPSRDFSTNVSDILKQTMQAQTRAMARKNKEIATKESVRLIMREDCARLGLRDLDADLPPVVHIAGTKGMMLISRALGSKANGNHRKREHLRYA
jgi:hypothetical protein